VPPDVLAKDIGIEPAARPGNDRRLDALPPFVVLDAHDHRIEHVGVAQQRVLDLGRSEVLCAPDDGVVDPTLDVQVVVGVEPALVGGAEETAVVDGGALAGVLPGDLAPRIQMMPGVPVGTGLPSSPRISISMPGTGFPAEDNRARTSGSSLATAARCSSGSRTVTVELVSVRRRRWRNRRPAIPAGPFR
jgi:hypothetical protein